LQRRRDYEIEGFTSDIVNLRQQLRNLEKNVLKYGTLEDKEMILLNLTRLTGERASKISGQIQNIKVWLFKKGESIFYRECCKIACNKWILISYFESL
jgi:coiled-coil domain-containing protein 77